VHEIIVPALNSNDVEYVLVEWSAPAGAEVGSGDPVAVIETSKATEELATDVAGVLEHLLLPGAACRPGTVIGRIAAAGSEAPLPVPVADPAPPRSPAGPAGTDALGAPVLTDAARALVERHHIAEERIVAIGKRVVRAEDIRQLAEYPAERLRDGTAEVLPVSALQRAVARTVTAASVVPSAFTVVRVYVDGRSDNPDVVAETIRATSAQRPRFPCFFARLASDGTLTALPGAQVGVTVDTGHGLYMPVLRDAESLSQRDISAALLRFRVKARRARFTAEELLGSNIGITLHTESAVIVAQPVIHPDHSCALAVCAVLEELALAPDGSVRIRNYVNVGLAYDHRVINGRDAVLFLDAIKHDIEDRES